MQPTHPHPLCFHPLLFPKELPIKFQGFLSHNLPCLPLSHSLRKKRRPCLPFLLTLLSQGSCSSHCIMPIFFSKHCNILGSTVNCSPVKPSVAIAGLLLLPGRVFFFSPASLTSARCIVRDKYLQTELEPTLLLCILFKLPCPSSTLSFSNHFSH